MQYYILYGEKCVDYLDGMWSFAIYNHKENLLFLSRDRFAEKPMYYSIQPEGIYFGSQITFIKNLSNKKFQKNYKKINEFLSLGPKPIFKNNESFYKDINLLGYSENLICNDEKNIKIKKYWNPKLAVNNDIELPEAINVSKNLLIETVKLRTRADVPAAFCLSGGIDSGSLASIAVKELNYKIKTFSIIDEDQRYNEEANVKKVVDDLECDHEILHIKKENFIENLSKLIKYHDESCIFSFSISTIMFNKINKRIWLQNRYFWNSFRRVIFWLLRSLFTPFSMFKRVKRIKKTCVGLEKNVEPYIRNETFKNPNLFIDNPDFRDYIYDHSQTLSKYLISPENAEFKEKLFTKEHFSNRKT